MKIKEIVFVVEEEPEQGYSAKALGYSIFTEGDSLTKLKDNIKDAIKCHFDKDDMPIYVRLHIITEEKFACA
jgi:predicted RNase H-like HicB family nuclease